MLFSYCEIIIEAIENWNGNHNKTGNAANIAEKLSGKVEPKLPIVKASLGADEFA